MPMKKFEELRQELTELRANILNKRVKRGRKSSEDFFKKIESVIDSMLQKIGKTNIKNMKIESFVRDANGTSERHEWKYKDIKEFLKDVLPLNISDIQVTIVKNTFTDENEIPFISFDIMKKA